MPSGSHVFGSPLSSPTDAQVKLASLKFLNLTRGRQASVRFTDETIDLYKTGSGLEGLSSPAKDSGRGTLSSRRSHAHLIPARTDLLTFGHNFRSMMMKSGGQSYMMTGFVDVETGDEITVHLLYIYPLIYINV
jgi:hypothetical protein